MSRGDVIVWGIRETGQSWRDMDGLKRLTEKRNRLDLAEEGADVIKHSLIYLSHPEN